MRTRTLSILSGVLLAQLALAAALYAWRDDPLAAARSDARLVAADLKDVDRLVVDGPASADGQPSARVELVKRDGRWRLPGYHDAPADGERVQALLTRLQALPRGLPVATSEAALARFRVGERDYERKLLLARGDGSVAIVFLGSSPAVRQASARTAADAAVYSVALAPYELPTAGAEWLDRGLLRRDAATLGALTVTVAGQPSYGLKRVGEGSAAHWELDGRRVDDARAKALVDAVATLAVDGVAGTAPPTGTPALTLQWQDARGATTWTLVPAGEGYRLRASDQPFTFELKAWGGRALLDASAKDVLLGAAPKPAP